MALKNEIEKLKFDKRLSEWHVNRGLLKAEDLKKHIDSLPDSGSNVANFDLTAEEMDDLDASVGSGTEDRSSQLQASTGSSEASAEENYNDDDFDDEDDSDADDGAEADQTTGDSASDESIS